MRKANLIIFTLFLFLILWAGFIVRLGYPGLTLWPWSHQWYMFSRSTDYIYKLRATGYHDLNIPTNIALEYHFKYPASRYTHRADEILPSHGNFVRLASYLCEKTPGIIGIELSYEMYRKQTGTLPNLDSPPDFVKPVLGRTPCT